MAKFRIATLILAGIAVAAIPQNVFARPDASHQLIVAQNETALPIQDVDPVITGGRSAAIAAARWAERSETRHRCAFCTDYQPFPQN
jgi:hypothetical protein